MDRIYSVGQVNGLVKAALEQALPGRLTVRGELSNYKRHHSGHAYFNLKDGSGVLPCVMWSSRFRTVRFEPANGLTVLATGNVDVYTSGGKYQLYVDRLAPEGQGALQEAFERMKAKLQAEGLFDDRHKRPLPRFPRRIAVLTSESGAAWHDITDSLHRRWPCATLLLCPVPVQGAGAGARIARAVRALNARRVDLALDLLIVGRGGGSLEDLWAFNEEVLARAIFDSRIPVISAVGHEVDTTLADYVADARASTPTQAGVVAAPDQREVREDLAHCAGRLRAHLRGALDLGHGRLAALVAREVLRRPEALLRERRQDLDALETSLERAARERLRTLTASLAHDRERIQRLEPHRVLSERRDALARLVGSLERGARRRVETLAERVGRGRLALERATPRERVGRARMGLGRVAARLEAAANATAARSRLDLEASANRLAALDPKAVLGRGYSITRHADTGALVRSPEDVRPGDRLLTELAGENLIASRVTNR